MKTTKKTETLSHLSETETIIEFGEDFVAITIALFGDYGFSTRKKNVKIFVFADFLIESTKTNFSNFTF